MDKEKFRIAVATDKTDGLNDRVAEVFGKANTFTIIDVEGGEIRKVEAIKNPAAAYRYGAGPIVVKELVDLHVSLVMGSEFGPGAQAILDQHGVAKALTQAGTSVRGAVEDVLRGVESGRKNTPENVLK